MLGESPSSPVVQSQLNFLTRTRNGVPDHIYDFPRPSDVPTIYPHLGPGDATDRYQFYHTTRALRMIGGPKWETWRDGSSSIIAHGQPWEGYPKWVMKHHVEAGTDGEGNPMIYWPGSAADGCQFSGSGHGTTWGTPLSLCMLAAAYDDYWLDTEFTPATGDCRYGYNNRLGHTRGTIPADTIVVMDYDNWQIDHDDTSPEENDSLDRNAVRHSGRANALMGDGGVRILSIGQIIDGMWTPEPAD